MNRAASHHSRNEIASPHGFAWGLKAYFAQDDDYVIARRRREILHCVQDRLRNLNAGLLRFARNDGNAGMTGRFPLSRE